MTRNSKKQVLVLLFGLLLSGSIYSQIETLYIYGTDNSQQEIAIGDVQKLTFSGSTLVVNKTDETTVVAGFDGLRLFNLVDNASSLYTWTGNSDNMWTKPENWRSYYVPQSFQNAMIPAVNPLPALDGNIAVNTLTIAPGAGLELGSHTLSANNIKAQALVAAAKQWHSIGFPFPVDNVYSEQFGEELTDNHYWLKTIDDDAEDLFDEIMSNKQIEAGKGYIIQFPLPQAGEEGYAANSVISYSGAVSGFAKSAFLSSFGSAYALQINPTLASYSVSGLSANQHVYQLNSAGDAYVLKDNSAVIAPFEAVLTIETAQQVPARISLNSDVVTGFSKDAKAENIVATRYYNLQGVEIYSPVSGGVFIEKTVYQSGAVSASKIIRK